MGLGHNIYSFRNKDKFFDLLFPYSEYNIIIRKILSKL